MAARSHLSIGEVLSLLREEFADITISKIRFLESQGLVDPERTPSGYRKFYEQDVERLRWILRQQRENFLPLKVIKGRLREGGNGTAEPEQLPLDADASSAGVLAGSSPDQGPARNLAPARAAVAVRAIDASAGAVPAGAEAAPGTGPLPAIPSRTAADPAAGPSGTPRERGSEGAAPVPVGTQTQPAAAAPANAVTAPGGKPEGAADASPDSLAGDGQAVVPAADRGGAGRVATSPGRRTRSGDQEELESYTAAELAAGAGVEPAMVEELQGFGLLKPRSGSGGTAYFDADGMEVVRLAASFGRHGVEGRHLRAWKTSAEREASLFEQVIMPLLHQRNPQARRQALETLEELAGLGAELRRVLLRQALRTVR